MVTGSETKMVIGMQWGNEGKGRIVDFIANRSDVVVRFQGASNGGRTILACGERYRIFYLPSGIHHDGKNCLICGGVALDLEKVFERDSDAQGGGCAQGQAHHKQIMPPYPGLS